MSRMITVKGTGKASVKPDLIVLTLSLESTDFDYEQTMRFATDAVEKLTRAIELTGIDKNELKTSRFNISTRYESFRDKSDNYKQRFAGYAVNQDFRLEFYFDTTLLGEILTAISKAGVDPTLQVQFSIKDQDAVREELLVKATQNARQKAEVLTKAAGVKLGMLVNIDYSWDELFMYSPTEYSRESKTMMSAEYSPEIVPDNIELNDTVSFIWEIN